ncbi:19706_t:CDS:1, partial [Dentiscutata erythropus]
HALYMLHKIYLFYLRVMLSHKLHIYKLIIRWHANDYFVGHPSRNACALFRLYENESRLMLENVYSIINRI